MSGKRKTIAVATGSRAESGLLLSTMHAIKKHPLLNLRVVVAGSHLVQGSWRDVEAAGFAIDAKVRMQVNGRSGRAADTDALAKGVAGFGKAFAAIRPDFVVVLGDRIEVLAAACAATVGGYRLAHIHGGDRAEGLADEAIRHAVSKLAQLHFPATTQSKGRLIRMGETPGLIYKVGSPAVDGLDEIEPVEDGPELIVMQHPVGDTDASEASRMRATLSATRGFRRVVMMPNLDPGGEGIRRAIRAARVKPTEHLPRERFLSLLKGAKAIAGNSSAGLIEAAVMRVPCVNIGPRQAGREKPGNVIDCDYGKESVARALRKALRLDLRRIRHPYGDGRAGRRIADTLALVKLQAVPLGKQNTY
jgi:UDP-hydrolysing UDP-N-acetyl-D-glucosamine 2-epimerase